jgi:tetratricopeptide (TPR) repeat protein
MWFNGANLIQHEIGYATSTDAIHWNKSPGNPVLKTGELGSWESWVANCPNIVYEDSIYKMWYYGHNNVTGNIGYATSSEQEATSWDIMSIKKSQKIIEVRMFNRTEFIKVDSLASILPNLQDVNLVNALNKLALAYSLNNSEKSLGYARQALSLSKQFNYPEGRAMAHYSIGNCQYILDNYSDALANQLKALWLYDSLEMYFEYGNLLSQIASIHSYSGSHDLACRYYQQAVDVFEKQNDTISLINTFLHLGYAYLRFGDTSNAIKQFKSRLNLAKANKNEWAQVYTYEALCYSYSGLNLDSVIRYFNKADTLLLSIDSTHYYGIGIPYSRISLPMAEAYLANGPDYYGKAEKHFRACKHLKWQYWIREAYGKATLCFLTERYDVTGQWLDMTINNCKTYLDVQSHKRFTYLNEKMESDRDLKLLMGKLYLLYYRLDTTLNNESSALEHHLLATQWRDNLHNQRARNKTAMMQGTFETESSLMRMAMLQKENEVKDLQIQQSRFLVFGMGGFLLVIIFIATLFIRMSRIKSEHKTVLIEQKMLRLQMNPHFIFNALSNIMNFIESKKTDKATVYLANFSSLLRSTLETTRKEHITLEEEIQGLINYLELQKLRYGNIFEYAIEVDKKLDPADITIPPMMIQPFIENAIEHGIRHKKSKGHIIIRFIVKGKSIICEIEDDGIGREKAYEVVYKTRKGHKSMATDIINDRIKVINKKMKQKIQMDIIDLKSKDDEPIGTKVVLNLPLI